ncbi:hypothetical protein [Roseofilum sp. Belize Diploria]|uniref:hypothetical protein n=1 Tax=Roseofilum sp. Belize Diploria TaxID=2821501 RepID=UPI001B09CDBD|nr:hypothetical protein [Roseofilum sp. Belize Diploria]MBP0008061.1 hypothetical protein [Roseofilum sp. Belize Diploria]
MKIKNWAALIAIATIAAWELGLRPHLIQSRLMAKLTAIQSSQCSAFISSMDWAQLKSKPPQSLTEVQSLIGEGCREELGAIAYEFQTHRLIITENDDGLTMVWEDSADANTE